MAIIGPLNTKTKAIGMAIGASIIAAVTTMLVPTSLLESITGASGLSELVPATAAPLGDKARALIAFTAGIVTMIIALAFLLRSSETKKPAGVQPVQEIHKDEKEDVKSGANMIAMLKERMGNMQLPKMPWSRDDNSDDVFELSDLPRLRTQDRHPDSPARRPISAARDLGDHPLDYELAPLPHVAKSKAPPEIIPKILSETDHGHAETLVVGEPVIEVPQPEMPASEPVHHRAQAEKIEPVPAAQPVVKNLDNTGASLSDLVAQFENAVENRKASLAELEVFAARIKQEKQIVDAPVADMSEQLQAPRADAPDMRPPLEAVPAHDKGDDDDEMDAALNAALATLQRMNVK